MPPNLIALRDFTSLQRFVREIRRVKEVARFEPDRSKRGVWFCKNDVTFVTSPVMDNVFDVAACVLAVIIRCNGDFNGVSNYLVKPLHCLGEVSGLKSIRTVVLRLFSDFHVISVNYVMTVNGVMS